MPRYFLEVRYDGKRYSGFQEQKNANSIQAEIEKAILVVTRKQVELTGSSRTDAGVHARQNFFHFDFDTEFEDEWIYNVNAVLPADIAIMGLYPVSSDSHCRFDAIARTYRYYIYARKNPFYRYSAYYFPYALEMDAMQAAAAMVKQHSDFTTFSKRNTQVKTFECNIQKSEWLQQDDLLIYEVKSNRFLRGMVRALTATMLQVGRGKLTVDQFNEIILLRDCTKASFAVPAHGLFLESVMYPENYFQHAKK